MSPLLSPSLALGSNVPLQLYGTAWKEDKTAELTSTALSQGFKGLDTANYPTAYEETLTGQGIAAALKSGIKREDIFIQSKFSPIFTHHPEKIPFEAALSIEEQVKQSIEQTFQHLEIQYLDSLLLHAPYEDNKDSFTAWKVLESFVPDKIRYIGVSNATLHQLQSIYEHATVKPAIVQNKFWKETKFDLELRSFCRDHGILYQAFWMLTHNPEVLDSEIIASVASKYKFEREAAFYLMMLCLGDIQVLNGTTKVERMEADLASVSGILKDGNIPEELHSSVKQFKRLLWKLASESKG
ncbi:putative aldo-keto reductase [Xylariaceae sp. FL0016]|nr:putative aldo-keto reductase [Xylariaceae sp. FL0016]